MKKRPKIFDYTHFQKERFRRYRQSIQIQKKGIHGLFADAVTRGKQNGNG